MTARAAAAMAVAVVAACGGGNPEPERVAGLAGSIVAVDGHYLYFECAGEGSPTVVLEGGFGATTRTWSDVQPQLARSTRTCSYDRAGLGGSARIPGVHDAGDEIDDLERLLDRADIDPPYVLVGHSYGGLLARLYAHEHPDDVAGVVLVEAAHPDLIERQLAAIPRTPPFSRLRREVGRRVIDGVDLRAGLALAGRVRSLDATRLVVVTGGKPGYSDLPPAVARALGEAWLSMQNELAALSTARVHVVALKSDHFVQRATTGQPDVVTGAVRAVVDASRRETRLPPCHQVFRGLAVRCQSG
jgi:pimeloyl-ACP methyl ester carboxylesterase